MDVKMKMLEAAIVQLRGRALEHIVAIEILLKNPVGVSDHTNFVADLMMHAGKVSEYEDAMNALNQYFVPKAAAAPVPKAPVPEPPLAERPGITPDQSPTLKKSLERQQIVAEIEKREKEKNERE
tara:strand:+ start:628 stop:1002 length:375 start_codon:yes stop_codon:yes gene_type:complete